MRLIGVTRLDQLGPHLVSGSINAGGRLLTNEVQLNTKALDPLIADLTMLTGVKYRGSPSFMTPLSDPVNAAANPE